MTNIIHFFIFLLIKEKYMNYLKTLIVGICLLAIGCTPRRIIHNNKIFVLNLDGYFDALIHLLDNMDTNGFMYDHWKDRIIVCPSVAALKALLS